MTVIIAFETVDIHRKKHSAILNSIKEFFHIFDSTTTPEEHRILNLLLKSTVLQGYRRIHK